MTAVPEPEPAAPHPPRPTGATTEGARTGTDAAGTSRTGTSATTMTDVALIATFAALLAVCAVLPAIPVGGVSVPITLQTFGVMLAGAVLGPRRGALAVLLYIAVGLAGLPIFSGGKGGLAVVAGPTFGYIASFPLAAALAGFLVQRSLRSAERRPWVRSMLVFGSCTVASLLLVHPLGIAVLGWRSGLSASEAIRAGIVFIPGDLIKNVAVAVVATAVHRAFPELLAYGRRRPRRSRAGADLAAPPASGLGPRSGP